MGSRARVAVAAGLAVAAELAVAAGLAMAAREGRMAARWRWVVREADPGAIANGCDRERVPGLDCAAAD
jgi:hypothetical protein